MLDAMATSHLSRERCKFIANNAAAYERKYDVGGSSACSAVSGDVVAIRKQIQVAKTRPGEIVEGALVNARRRKGKKGDRFKKGLDRAVVLKVRRASTETGRFCAILNFSTTARCKKRRRATKS